MNQEPQPFLLLKQLILLPIFRGSICAVTRGSHCAGERGSVYAGIRGSICVDFPDKEKHNYLTTEVNSFVVLTNSISIDCEENKNGTNHKNHEKMDYKITLHGFQTMKFEFSLKS